MKIFISYSRSDAGDLADKISRSLNQDHDVFTDVNKIHIGDVWGNTIETSIATCDIFIVIVTDGSLRSPEVGKEVLLAKEKNKKIIPCFYTGISKNLIRWGLEKLQGIEFTTEFQLAREVSSKIRDLQPEQETEQETEQEPVRPSHRKLKIGLIIVIIITSVVAYGYLNHINSPNGLNEKGDSLFQEGKYDEAISYYDKAISIDPNNIYAYTAKGNVLYWLGKYDEAISYYDKGLAINPKDSTILSNKGNVLSDQNKNGQAMNYLLTSQFTLVIERPL